MIVSFSLMFIVGSFYSMVHSGINEAHQSAELQAAHAIGLAMYSYADEHDGKYPTGNSSTEIFQKLMNSGYITDPSIFYFPMTGKTKADGKILKPENVCWDVTDAARMDDSPSLPLLFATGYKIDYVAGGKAHPLANADLSRIPAFYISNAANFNFTRTGGISVIDPTFDPKGKTYRQLTPNGPLP